MAYYNMSNLFFSINDIFCGIFIERYLFFRAHRLQRVPNSGTLPIFVYFIYSKQDGSSRYNENVVQHGMTHVIYFMSQTAINKIKFFRRACACRPYE